MGNDKIKTWNNAYFDINMSTDHIFSVKLEEPLISLFLLVGFCLLNLNSSASTFIYLNLRRLQLWYS